ncbi:MAG: peptidase, partial [Flavobacteriaceae bacterium]|nr:peptidase [Flavobacteriaceae bacterium]
MKKLLYLLAFITASIAGAQDYGPIIQSYLNSNRSQLGLTAQDIEQVTINSESYSKSMNVHNVYASQTLSGIEVFNSVSNFAVKNGTVVYSKVSFVANLSSKINTTTPAINASTAISKAAQNLG